MDTILTMKNSLLSDMGYSISTYAAKNPLLEKFDNAMEKTFDDLNRIDQTLIKPFKKCNFYKLSQIREYVKHVDPLNPWETEDGYAFKSHYCGRKCKNDIRITKACLVFLKNYYKEDFDKQMKSLWHFRRRGKMYSPYELKQLLSA